MSLRAWRSSKNAAESSPEWALLVKAPSLSQVSIWQETRKRADACGMQPAKAAWHQAATALANFVGWHVLLDFCRTDPEVEWFPSQIYWGLQSGQCCPLVVVECLIHVIEVGRVRVDEKLPSDAAPEHGVSALDYWLGLDVARTPDNALEPVMFDLLTKDTHLFSLDVPTTPTASAVGGRWRFLQSLLRGHWASEVEPWLTRRLVRDLATVVGEYFCAHPLRGP